jgi:hypothetical protein
VTRIVRAHSIRGPALRLMAGFLLIAGLSACGRPPATVPELNASYERALERTAPLAAVMQPGSPEETLALDRLQGYFALVTPGSVRLHTAEVYAPAAYLNDTLVAIEGVGRIEAYLAKTTENARQLRVQFLDHTQAGPDYYIRWRMTVQADALNGGEPVVTYGITQFRFDPEGRVLIHKDFWDAATGFYEQLPVLGSLVRTVRAAVERQAE